MNGIYFYYDTKHQYIVYMVKIIIYQIKKSSIRKSFRGEGIE